MLAFILYKEHFDPSIVFDSIRMMYNAANKEYQTFMKLIWA